MFEKEGVPPLSGCVRAVLGERGGEATGMCRWHWGASKH